VEGFSLPEKKFHLGKKGEERNREGGGINLLLEGGGGGGKGIVTTK